MLAVNKKKGELGLPNSPSSPRAVLSTHAFTEFDFAGLRMALLRYSMKEIPLTLCAERCSVFVNLSIPKTEPIPEAP